MNYVALQQNILGKMLKIGTGFVGKTEKDPFLTKDKFKIYLNGKHELPELTELDERFILGKITHPYAMMGMPSSAGLIEYELYIGKEMYLISATLTLEDVDDEPATDVVALSLRNDFNIIGNPKVAQNSSPIVELLFIFKFWISSLSIN